MQAVVVLGFSVLTAAPVHAFEWENLWSSAEQRAAKQLEKQQYDELIDNAPNASWRGLGEYRKGEYTAAAKSFEQRRAQAEEAGLVSDVEQAMYNQANAHVLEENYEDAISVFDELLEANPEHNNAEHNRNIALQLLEQQQQEQQEQQQQESGEQGEQSDENQSESDEQSESGDGEQSDTQDSQQGESEGQDDQQSSPSDEQQADGDSQNSDSNAEDAAASAQEQAEQAAAAEAAMQAERARQDQEPSNENASESDTVPLEAPLTEREQANEQWLRQIPDDPAGLLQRKIQNRHQTDFPKVRDSDEPW